MGQLNADIIELLGEDLRCGSASLPVKFWPYAFKTIVFLLNRLLTKARGDKAPFEVLHEK